MTAIKKTGHARPLDSQLVDDRALRQFAGYHLKRAYNVVRADLTMRLKPLGLRITTYSCLLLIVQNPGIRQSELASALDIERPNLVTILDDLNNKGWIERKRMTSDKRAFALVATKTGHQVCKKAVEANHASEATVLAALSERQTDNLVSTLKNIETALADTDGEHG